MRAEPGPDPPVDPGRLEAAEKLVARLRDTTGHVPVLNGDGSPGLVVPAGMPAAMVAQVPPDLRAELSAHRAAIVELLRRGRASPRKGRAEIEDAIRALPCRAVAPAQVAAAVMGYWRDHKPRTAEFLAGAFGEVAAGTLTADLAAAHFLDCDRPDVKKKPNRFVRGLGIMLGRAKRGGGAQRTAPGVLARSPGAASETVTDPSHP